MNFTEYPRVRVPVNSWQHRDRLGRREHDRQSGYRRISSGRGAPVRRGYVYTGAKKAAWPDADFVVGNPPYLGARTIRRALGSGYLDALRSTYQHIPEHADYVMYWWDLAADLCKAGKIRRFGLITTRAFRRSSAGKSFNVTSPNAKLSHFVSSYPMTHGSTPATEPHVRVAMTVCDNSGATGVLASVVSEQQNQNGDTVVEMQSGFRNDLRQICVSAPTYFDASRFAQTQVSSCVGYQLTGKGFALDATEAKALDPTLGSPGSIVRPLLAGRDITQRDRGRYAINVSHLSEAQLRSAHPKAFQWLLDRVKPERDTNSRESVKKRWWVYGEARNTFTPALKGIDWMLRCR